VIGHVVGPNLTPDRETGIGNWTEEQIIAALRGGKRPDGTIIGPPMPIFFYRQFSDRDVAAIAAHLRSIKPIRHAVARTEYKMPLPSSYGPPVTHMEEPSRDEPVAYGAYLAGPPGHCVGCHTPFGKRWPVARYEPGPHPIQMTASENGATTRSSVPSPTASARTGPVSHALCRSIGMPR
jgi:mono/diheme cytochrome c family protein